MMTIQKQRIEIHSGLEGEVFVDTAQSIGELVIAGKSYGFEWTNAGLAWDREPPYHSIITRVATFVESTFH
jgi:hypothetical protein